MAGHILHEQLRSLRLPLDPFVHELLRLDDGVTGVRAGLPFQAKVGIASLVPGETDRRRRPTSRTTTRYSEAHHNYFIGFNRNRNDFGQVLF